mgnify:CR=1 FL=1
MKIIILNVATVVSLLLFSVTSVNATITNSTVTDHYKIIIDQSPYNVEVCYQREAQRGDPTKGAIIGGIVGGVIGNEMKGKNSGKVGAIIGTLIGIEHQKNIGKVSIETYCQTETRYNQISKNVYSHSVIEFELEGQWYSLSFVK